MLDNIFKISVVIPTHNRQDYLVECINSVLSQTVLPGEIIVVNNGSSTLDDQFESMSHLIKIVNTEPDIGASRARNIGAIKANSDYIAFLDDDDFWSSDYIEKVIEYLLDNPVDLLITNKHKYSVKDEPDVIPPFKMTYSDVFDKTVSIGGQAMVVNKTSFFEIGGFSVLQKNANDKDLVMRFLISNKLVEAYLEPIAYFRHHESGRLTDSMYQGNELFYHKYKTYMNLRQRVIQVLKTVYQYLKK